ncbi:MAG: O-antigen translocase [Pseudomonadota bacterium]
MKVERNASQVLISAFGWGSTIAAVRMICSFLSIKVTAVYLGPAGLALVAQYSNFVSLFQSMLGQGLVTGLVRLTAEYGVDSPQRRLVYSTALCMAVVLTLLLCLGLFIAAPLVSNWLLMDQSHAWLIAVTGIAVGAAMISDLFHGAMSVSKEINLIGTVTIISTILSLVIFAPCSFKWGITGGLWASFAVMLISALVTTLVVLFKSKGVRLSEFLGPFDKTQFRRILSFYPMLIVNGMLTPLVLILVRDTLTKEVSLEQAGLWQATWRLSEVYQGAIVSSITLYFMPSMGERVNHPVELRKHIFRTLLIATGTTGALALGIFLLREPIIHIVFHANFQRVGDLLPLQLVGDVLKMAGWILLMSLVAVVRTRSFIGITILASVAFTGLSKWLVPSMGIDGVLWAYVCTGAIQLLCGALALHDVLLPRGHHRDKAVAAVEASPL